ncbi:uncharacterized protein LOC125813508 [Solanum verrucosum]|uniref:uncharacterized protein LOC125813508 n=1 Tax=Solanum verrucosum TaxID=315347 RepID=UPI0020D02C3B|nr:uncharacterized protein LOC125813508 [Solanum verrucosum]
MYSDLRQYYWWSSMRRDISDYVSRCLCCQQVNAEYLRPHVGKVAYELALPPTFLAIHLVFHVSILRRYVPDESHVLQFVVVELDDRLTYIEKQVAILERTVRQLRSRIIPVVKVHWRHRPVEEDTWETEQEVREQFPDIFEPSGTS